MPYVYANPHQIRGNGTAIVALITGLIGLIMTVVTGWIPIVGFFLMLLPSVLAIIFGFVGKAQARAGAPHGAKALAGLTCGFVALLLTVLMQACWGLLIGGVVISAAEIADESAVIEELKGVEQEIQQRVEAEWIRMKAEFPELEIEIVDDEAAVASEPNDGTGSCCEGPAAEDRTDQQQENSVPAKGLPGEQESELIII